MTNPLIPYSFIPGTKAKANEVNANFISIADAIDNTKQYTIDQISSLDTKMQNKIEDLVPTIPKKDLSDTNYLTNCILEAPNGVAEYSADTITVKKGLRVLIPDGRNEDGSLKSIDFTLEEDAVITIDQAVTTFLTINMTGVIAYTSSTKTSFIVSETTPDYQQTMFWYQPSTNYFRYSSNNGQSWTIKQIAIIGEFSSNADTITYLKTYSTPELIKDTDKNKIINWVSPDWSKGVSLSVSSGIISENGYLSISGTYQSNYYGQLYINQQLVYREKIVNAAEETSSFVQVTKGDKYVMYGHSVNAVFYPMKGAN